MGAFDDMINRSGRDKSREVQIGNSLANFNTGARANSDYGRNEKSRTMVDEISNKMVEDLKYSLGCVVAGYAHDLTKTADYAWNASYIMKLAGEMADNQNGKAVFNELDNRDGDKRQKITENIKKQVTKLVEALKTQSKIEVAVKRSAKGNEEPKIDPAGSGWIIDNRSVGKYLSSNKIAVINPNIKVPNMKPGEYVGKVVNVAELLALNYDKFNQM